MSKGKPFLKLKRIPSTIVNRSRLGFQFCGIWLLCKWIFLLLLIFILIDELVLNGRSAGRRQKLITFALNHSKFSDQLFELCIGIAIAKGSGQRFYLQAQSRSRIADWQLFKISQLFPLLQPHMMVLTKNTSQMFVRYKLSIKQNLGSFIDKHNGPFVFDSQYAFDTLFPQKNEQHIRHLLEFPTNIQQLGKRTLEKLNISTRNQSAICVHIENKLQLSKDDDDANMHNTVLAARTIAIDMNLTEFYIFTDDPSFSYAIEKLLTSYDNWQRNVHVNHFTQAMDLYVVKRVCRAVLLTSTQSIHGFWIGFFAEPNIVYYFKPKQSHQKHLYLESWIPYVEKKPVRNLFNW